MIERAEDGDQKAGEYLVDRIYGKPSQKLNVKQDEPYKARVLFLPTESVIEAEWRELPRLPEGNPILLEELQEKEPESEKAEE